MPQSQFGTIEVFEDFVGFDPDKTWAAGQFNVGNVFVTSVNEGSIENTVDEPGGIIAFTSDTGDDDNVAIFAGPFKAADGPLVMEARFKYSNVDCAIFVGWTETLSVTTPVMPAEFATATMTYNGTGSIAGFNYDVDGTTDDFRAVFADAGAALTGNGAAANGTRANATLTADNWFIARVEVDPNGAARAYFGDQTSAPMKLIASCTGGLSTSTVFFPCLMLENRSGNARVLEVDYFYAKGYRDWTP